MNAPKAWSHIEIEVHLKHTEPVCFSLNLEIKKAEEFIDHLYAEIYGFNFRRTSRICYGEMENGKHRIVFLREDVTHLIIHSTRKEAPVIVDGD